MSHDLFCKSPCKRNWARGTAPATPSQGAVISGRVSVPFKTLGLGVMALGTLAGLTFITSPWWKPLPIEPGLRRHPARGRMNQPPWTASRITWSRR